MPSRRQGHQFGTEVVANKRHARSRNNPRAAESNSIVNSPGSAFRETDQAFDLAHIIPA
jgi:hypothetical protein